MTLRQLAIVANLIFVPEIAFAGSKPTQVTDGFTSYGTRFHGKCVAGDCVNNVGSIEFEKPRAMYSGEFLNGLPHGSGKLKVDGYHRAFDGIWYSGVFVGKCLEGTCKAGYGIIELMKTRMEIHRDKTFILPTMWRGPEYYMGTFKDYLPDGFGTLSFMTGATNGSFNAGKIQGYAEFLTNDGESYHGEYVSSNFEGPGVYACAPKRMHLFKNCKRISGKFARHLFTSGTIEYRDGKIFQGAMSESYMMKGTVKCPKGKDMEVNLDYNQVNAYNCNRQ